MKSNQKTKRCKSNTRKVLKDFCESTSLHGYGYIYNNNSTFLKSFWLLVIVSTTGLGIFLLVQNTIEFLEHEIYTTTETSSAPLSVSNVWCTLFHSRSSYEHFMTIYGHFFHQPHWYILQNWGSDDHFEVLNMSKS